MDTLEIRGLKKRFGSHTVLDDISFSVPQNCVFGFIGVNGAGKTTTMRIILGLLKADSGEIYVCGERVSFGETRTNRLIGYLPDVPEFYGYMRPKEYLKLCGEIVGLKPDEIKSRSLRLLDLVGLSDADKKISAFSRGMKQRLGVAQALLAEPQLLICDEPTSALDPIGRRDILEILRQIKGKTTVIFSTHILSDVQRICDRVAVLHQGKIVVEGALNDLGYDRKSKSITLEYERETDPDEVARVLSNSGLAPVRCESTDVSIENLFLEVAK
ncbi:MAG: ABC transporter ATP-binding protein [Oscillospiraceae bacterium]|nr:ABC transporter ATP-binding protein [Oscillospiraceae bacterium]